MSAFFKKTVEDLLAQCVDPISGKLMVGLAQQVDVQENGDSLLIIAEIDASHGSAIEGWRQEVERQLKSAFPQKNISLIFTAHRKVAPSPPSLKRHAATPSIKGSPIGGVKQIIAVASGKGGVGKSTVAANIAAYFATMGLKTGLLDADIYGPSVPMLMGMNAKPQLHEGKIIPLERYGIKFLSMGLIADPEKAVVWRGPMVQSALQQFLRQGGWAPLDVLVLDLPPGTGDTHIALCQEVPITGAVIVSTPQDMALIDAVKAVQMFQRLQVPILGIIENMSMFCCPNCQHPSPIFGEGGAEHKAKEWQIDFLGKIPLTMNLRTSCDKGEPIFSCFPEDPAANAIQAISQQLQAILAPKLAA
ncbi:MAG: Mrp/NBP35 family ATP-binding protein [Alphaproteobacteria bacterium]